MEGAVVYQGNYNGVGTGFLDLFVERRNVLPLCFGSQELDQEPRVV